IPRWHGRRVQGRGMPGPPSGVEVPVYRSAAPSSMEARYGGRIGLRQKGVCRLERLAVRCRNVRAIAPPHQHAVLGLAQVRNAHGEPYSDRGQRDGKGKGRNVCQHAMTKVVRLIPVPLVARQVVLWLSLLAQLAQGFSPPTRRVNRGARPEFEHAVLALRRNGLLGFHCCQLRDFLTLSNLARSRCARQKLLTWHGCDNHPSRVSWNLP